MISISLLGKRRGNSPSGGSLSRLGFLGLSVFTFWGFGLSAALGQLDQTGQWSAVETWPWDATHAVLLQTGKVMFWPSFANGDNPTLWDPEAATNAFTKLPQAGVPASVGTEKCTGSTPDPDCVNIFCSGHAFLSNGKLLVAGGHHGNYKGIDKAFIFDPLNPAWTALDAMNKARWYPTAITLPSGNVLVISGQVDGNRATQPGSYNEIPQIWQNGSWTDLNGAALELPYYPYTFVAPNGKVFVAGPDSHTRYLNLSTGHWETPLGSSNAGPWPRNWGSAVMYRPGRILVMGGTTCDWYDNNCSTTQFPTNTAATIDLTSGTWTATNPMKSGQDVNGVVGRRKLHNATLLPDGTVFVNGGSRSGENPNKTASVPANESEIWTPNPGNLATGTWSAIPGPSPAVYRAYHSIALLLRDGRVLTAGGNGKRSANIYSPPYLFKGTRPAITSAPGTIYYQPHYPSPGTFFVKTASADSITKVTLLALGSVTHGFNMGQRYIELNSSPSADHTGLDVHPPADANQAPPGYYMLFILNSAPSVAKIVQLHL